ncbi:M14 family metallopeptidase [Heyndrickxia acidicola]|uniref:M14 family metallopeptidase n=1 Tax=Heyndrickxia acidicola TaxID=209389 RepID=A0ABU6MGD2_9BACI|nr:M14 family metallopeptidase [Heyndrickxia acidicola]MED1203738.1 M14 family metallopeptidase [Heyndrickxia acidicola]
MMDLRELWSIKGLFFSIDEQEAPAGMCARVTVPSHRTSWESAAMVEIAGRIGLHLTDLPLPIFDHLFIFDQLDSAPTRGRPNLHLVIGYESEYLARVLGKRSEPLLTVRNELQEESGILYVSQDENQSLLVITGTSPKMTLHAARSLVTDHFVDVYSKGESLLFIPKEMNVLPQPSLQQGVKPLECYSLHTLFTTEGLYQQIEGEIHPTLDVSMRIRNSHLNLTIANVEMAASLAQSAGYVCFPLTTCMNEENGQRFLICWEAEEATNGQIEWEINEVEGKPALRIRAHPNQIVKEVREIINEYFSTNGMERDTWIQRFSALKSLNRDIYARAQLGMRAFTESRVRKVNHLIVPDNLSKPSEFWNRYLTEKGSQDFPFVLSVEEEKPIWTVHWEDSGELADIESYLLHTLPQFDSLGILNKNFSIEITTSVSGDSFIKWSVHFKRVLKEGWGIESDFIHRDANKSGLHWAMKEVLPFLKQENNLHTIEIQARAFQPKKKHLDLVHRFLQEMYPFDAILSEELSLPLERINLTLNDEPSAPMFQVIARGKQGSVLASFKWDGWAESCPYMMSQPGYGNVMIPFAGCRIYQKGAKEILASQSFKTNPYRFWLWYQGFVLPELVKQIGSHKGIPKFSRLECHVEMDALDIKIPHIEEVSSVLEALHEDIYFFTLHALHEHGKQAGDPGWDAPGAILPFMHKKCGMKPKAEIALYTMVTEPKAEIVYESGERKTIRMFPQETMNHVRITKLTKCRNELTFLFSGFDNHQLEKECGEWLASSEPGLNYTAGCVERLKEKSLDHDVFVNEDVEKWLQINKKKMHGKAFPIDFSFNGQWIWLVELYAKGITGETLSSFQKHCLYKPTFFLNARHHANEVSSTNAALQLIEKYAGRNELLKRINLVIVPLENVDGAALHAKMAAEHPFWKLHAARYNACGIEYAKYRFKPDAPFGEARVYPFVWQRWAPDVVLDDHGVPSHEWIQPFSGYNSPPRFPVSYWIPSSRMYTIWRELKEASPRQRDAYDSLRSFLTKRLEEDKRVANDNTMWLNTYRRWGNNFDDIRFPVELSHGSIAYTRESKANIDSHDLVERFSQWVTADLMTEVNDETVYDKELAACKHAHHVVHQAIIDWMKERKLNIQLRREHLENGTIRIGLERVRPL